MMLVTITVTGFFEGYLAEASREKPLPIKKRTMLPGKMYRDPRKTDFVVLETILTLKTSSHAHIKIQTKSVSTCDILPFVRHGRRSL